MKPEQWIISGEVGTSSKTIWAVMMDAVIESRKDSWDYSVTHDPSDFRRCYNLLVSFPDWRARLPEVAKMFPEWTGFVREWDRLTKMYEDVVVSGKDSAPEMYALMQKLEDEGQLANGWVQDSPNGWHRDQKKERGVM